MKPFEETPKFDPQLNVLTVKVVVQVHHGLHSETLE